MTGRSPRKPRPPLDAESLQSLALRYVERFATSRLKLADYLRRKLRERGWDGDRQPDIDALVGRFSELGYVDDRAFAAAKARSLSNRGYGGRRVSQSLQQAGIDQADRGEAEQVVDDSRIDAAVRFARRKRIGPFAPAPLDGPAKEKALAAMIRAGHPFDLARRIVHSTNDGEFDVTSLGQDW